MSGHDADTIIVGLGPVGALTALLLAEEGLDVVVCERSTTLVELPRAVGLDGESTRAFQRIGRADAIAGIVQPRRDVEEICFANSKRQRLFGIEMIDDGPHGYRDVSFFDQPELEAWLRAEVDAHPKVDVRLGCEVRAVRSAGEHAEIDVRDAAGREATLTAPWIVGCDGASSFVRAALDIDWESLGYDQDWLVIDIIAHDTSLLPMATMQVCDPERLTSYICVKDPNRRWEFQLRPGETREEMLEPARIRALLDEWLPADRYDLRRAAVYQFHAATAAQWQRGRVLLAGDAAHQTPPFLGQGLNAGFRDAVNIGWKIPLVHRGVCDAALLETYGEERDAHARDVVETAVMVGKLMEVIAAREAGRPDPHTLPPGPGDGGAPTMPPLRSGLLVASQVGPGASVGHLVRQPRVKTRAGGVVRFDELLGTGFALVGRSDADLVLGEAGRSIADRLGAARVSLEGVAPIEGEMDRAFAGHPAALIRPDRVVYGVVDEAHTLDALLEGLARKAGLRGA